VSGTHEGPLGFANYELDVAAPAVAGWDMQVTPRRRSPNLVPRDQVGIAHQSYVGRRRPWSTRWNPSATAAVVKSGFKLPVASSS
jgi:hypothetical protein